MKVFYNSVNNKRAEARRQEILHMLRMGSQNITDLFRYFKGSTKRDIIKHDLRNFQEIGIVGVIKFQGHENVYFIKK